MNEVIFDQCEAIPHSFDLHFGKIAGCGGFSWDKKKKNSVSTINISHFSPTEIQG